MRENGSWVYIDNDQERVIDSLARCVRIRNRMEKMIKDRVVEARANGVGWKEIGQTLGVSRQAAQQKYGTK